jgi:hypothetical protein
MQCLNPVQIKTLQEVHRTAVACLPSHERTSIVQVKLAETILRAAAAGEADRIRLLSIALVRHRTEQIDQS